MVANYSFLSNCFGRLPFRGNYYSFCAALSQFSGESLVKRSRQFEVEGEHLCPHSQLSRTLDDEDVDLHTGCFFHWYPPKKLKYGIWKT